MATLHLVAGARPNFMKIGPLYHALARAGGFRTLFVHTGQHYDSAMSDVFLRDMGLPAPDINLEVGSGSHAEQTAGVMVGYERLARDQPPDWTIVVGDVNSTLACTLAAKKLGIKVAHLEAGLRSFDRSMPEEINRVVTDALADLLWTPSSDADDNLRREGVAPERIVRVGNIMIDAFELLRSRIAQVRMAAMLNLPLHGYGLVTLHRPSNVDDRATLAAIVAALAAIARKLPLVFAVHPRTRYRLTDFGLWDTLRSERAITMVEPLDYVSFMSLVQDSRLVITDSGGVQEETTYLGIACLTLRDNTERPITVTQGTNRLVQSAALVETFEAVLTSAAAAHSVPEFWDGHTADRVVASLQEHGARD
jgi:UDP-N-acetylglucosamine 2-epimerase (non-hydrolysing)